ncbi:hypothetical protein BDZ91DRAFT_710006 [Kalaharituber pfeilii]|nr:hypothetical protein BDZ91DRAFT_710006 [Kalaharituber pfeilii]
MQGVQLRWSYDRLMVIRQLTGPRRELARYNNGTGHHGKFSTTVSASNRPPGNQMQLKSSRIERQSKPTSAPAHCV